ncbi:MAG: DUF5131 family protein [Actinomycetales bacterium]|nr:DUF5131 family protein [Actinomycetales bacterium]
MGQETNIEWTDATWNPIRGCSRISQGCVNCYAEKVAARFSGPGLPYEGLVTEKGRWNGTVKTVPEKLVEPLRWTRPRMVFANSMSDLFHESLSNLQIAAIFGVMAAATGHTFQVLTKRADRMAEWFKWAEEFAEEQRGIVQAPCTHEAMVRAAYTAIEKEFGEAIAKRLLAPHWKQMQEVQVSDNYGSLWPLPNVWVGVSVESDDTRWRIDMLEQVPAAVKWVSAEPLIGELNPLFSQWAIMDWIVVGGESGPGARPCQSSWVASLAIGANAANVPLFVKQLGAAYSDPINGLAGVQLKVSADAPQPTRRLKHPKGGDMAEWPPEFQVREWPKAGGAQ